MNTYYRNFAHSLIAQSVIGVALMFPFASMAGEFTMDAFVDIGEVSSDSDVAPGIGLGLRHKSGFGVELSAQRLGNYSAHSTVMLPPLRNPVSVYLLAPSGRSVALSATYRYSFGDSNWFAGVRAGAHRWDYDLDVHLTFTGDVIQQQSRSGSGLVAGVELGRLVSNNWGLSLTAQHLQVLGPDQFRYAVRVSRTF